jgi:hypothetical protein
MEKVRQSDTWALTLMRGWEPKALLIWMWTVAWEQTPCGSLPNDEALIAARLELTPKVWQKHRDVLMRNWWLADDGRLYHDTITVRVLAMLDKRANDAQRAANRRARKADADGSPTEVTSASRVTHAVLTGEFDTKHQALSTTKTPPTPQGECIGFERFWQSWPAHHRKAAKAQCLRKWTANGCEEMADRIVAHVEASKASDPWRKDGGAFIPAPLVYLNQARYEAPTEGDVQAANWTDTRQGIEAKGVELGLGKWDQDAFDHGRGEMFSTYEARVLRTAGVQLRRVQ